MPKCLVVLLFLIVLMPGRAAGDDVEAPAPLDPQRVNFTIANTLFTAMHELGHAVIHEFGLPVLGGEERAADNLAVLLFIAAERDAQASAFPFYSALAAAILGQRLIWESGIEAENLDLFFWARHELSIQRYNDAACLFYGSAPGELWFIPELTDMPEARAFDCDEEYELLERSASQLRAWVYDTQPDAIARDQVIPVIREPAGDPVVRQIADIIDRDFLSSVFRALQSIIPIPKSMTVIVKNCDHPNAYWDRDEKELVLCHELIAVYYGMSEDFELPEQIRALDEAQARASEAVSG